MTVALCNGCGVGGWSKETPGDSNLSVPKLVGGCGRGICRIKSKTILFVGDWQKEGKNKEIIGQEKTKQ